MRASSAMRVLCAMGICAALGPTGQCTAAVLTPASALLPSSGRGRGCALERAPAVRGARHEPPEAAGVAGQHHVSSAWRPAPTHRGLAHGVATKYFLFGSGALEAVELLAQHQRLLPERLQPVRGFTIAAAESSAATGGKVSSQLNAGCGRRVVAVNGTSTTFSDGRAHDLMALESVAMSEMRADAGIFLVGQVGTDSVFLSSVVSSALDELLAGSATPIVAAVDAEILDRLLGRIDSTTLCVLHIGGGSAAAPTIAAAAAAAAAEADIFAKLNLIGSTVESWDAVAPAVASVLEEVSVCLPPDGGGGSGHARGDGGARCSEKHGAGHDPKHSQPVSRRTRAAEAAKGARGATDAAGACPSCPVSPFVLARPFPLPAPCSRFVALTRALTSASLRRACDRLRPQGALSEKGSHAQQKHLALVRPVALLQHGHVGLCSLGCLVSSLAQVAWGEPGRACEQHGGAGEGACRGGGRWRQEWGLGEDGLGWRRGGCGGVAG